MKTTKEMYYYKEKADKRIEELKALYNKKDWSWFIERIELDYTTGIEYDDEFLSKIQSWSGTTAAKLMTVYNNSSDKAVRNHFIGWWDNKELNEEENSTAVKQRGGARKGAGRKPSEIKKKTISLYLTERTINQIKVHAKQCNLNVSDFIEKILENTIF